MRIIAGSRGGLQLKAPKGYTVRPTADQVREAMFNILVSRFALQGAAVLSLTCLPAPARWASKP